MASPRAKRARRNREIDSQRVRVIDSAGEQAGILSLDEGIAKAKEEGLDLVEVSPNADPPVCRVMDFGKYIFEESKKARSAKKKQKTIQVKEVKFRPTTEDGDYQVKLRALIKFLSGGDKAKVSLRFRGREMAHQEIGRDMLKRVQKDLEELSTVEQFPKMEGRQMIMVLAPKRT